MRVAVCLLMLVGVLVGVMQGSSASGLLPRSASLLDQEDTKEKRQQDDLGKGGRLDDKKILRDVVKNLDEWLLSHEDDSDNEQNDAKRQILGADNSDLEHNRFKRSPLIGAIAAIVSAIAVSVTAGSSVAIAARGRRGLQEGYGEADAPFDVRLLSHEDDSDNEQNDAKRQILGADSSDLEHNRFKRSPLIGAIAAIVSAIALSVGAASSVAITAKKYGHRGLQEGFGEADAPLDDRMADRISTLNNNIKRSLSTFNKVFNDGQRRKRQSGEGKLDIFGNPVFVNEIERLNKAGLLNRDDFDILLEEESNFLKNQ